MASIPIQRVDMRCTYPLRFGDRASEQSYARRVEAVRARLRPGSFAVAPSVTVQRTQRGVLREGDLISVEDLLDELDGDVVIVSRQARWAELLRDGMLVEGL